jgi:2-keto-4-pentenoate hydratase/2-oxohepta-3-ene-1,7-dioic acid hydratase in catechol pathway/regulator of RNase E activity RraA
MAAPPPPTKIFAVHTNYASSAAAAGRTPDVPSYFLKPVSSLAGDGGVIMRPAGTELLRVEGEIAVIVGRRARHLQPRQAAAHIGWFAAANDVGLFDMRWADRGSNLFSKGQDGFTPLGPPIAADGIDRSSLRLRTIVNGAVVQEDTSEALIFPFEVLIADLSRFMTLEPGDVILTGTPAGAPLVEPGDEVEVELEGAGSVRSTIVEGPALADFGAQPRITADARAAALGRGGGPAAVAPLSAQARDALRSVSTATLTVVLSRRGITNACIEGVRSTRPDLRLFGYAHTLRYVPLREDVRDADTAELNAQKRAVETIGPQEVLVIDARRDPRAGTIGDILAARAVARGASGIVTDGGLRDSAAVGLLDIPTYYQASHPAVLGRIHFPLESGVPIACGGALVMPGDVIVGDSDGVVVVPAALAEDVAAEAAAQESREAWALERVKAGDSIRGVYPIDDAHRPRYEEWLADADPAPRPA